MRPYACLLAVGLMLGGQSAVAQPSEAGPRDGTTDSSQGADAAEGDGSAADSAPASEDPSRTKARALFMEGVARVKQAQWSEALASFEASQQLFPHATTTFNIGACERAMGRYTRARQVLRKALAQADRGEGQLAASLRVEAEGYIGEIERLLVRLDVRLDTRGSRIAIDGRPLVSEGSEQVAGLAAPGLGSKAPGKRFQVVMDPGAHVITLSRKGYADAVVNRTYPPGNKSSLNLRLDRLPATLQISSNVRDAIVSVNGKDFGPAPVSVLRPPGRYSVLVNRDGFEPYEATVNVKPGEESALRATLVAERFQLTKQWWFWAGAAAVVVGGAALTYYLTRPDPEPKPYDSGSTGWLVEPIRF